MALKDAKTFSMQLLEMKVYHRDGLYHMNFKWTFQDIKGVVCR